MEHEQEHQYQREFKHKASLNTPSVEDVNQLMEGLLSDLIWLLTIADRRIEELNTGKMFLFSDFPPPDLSASSSAYKQLVTGNALTNAERLLLICSIIPHVAPYELTKRLRHDENHLKLKYNTLIPDIKTPKHPISPFIPYKILGPVKSFKNLIIK